MDLLPALLPPACAIILQTAGVVQALGSLMGEANPRNSLGNFFLL